MGIMATKAFNNFFNMDEPFQTATAYHIYNAANGIENLFREAKNYDFFLDKYCQYIDPIAETYAYCLMPNHFHAVICTRGEEDLKEAFRIKDDQDLQGFQNLGGLLAYKISKQFSNCFNSYTKAFNKRYGRKGSLFSPNIKRKEVQSDQYITQLILYIHNNPVKHGFVKDPWDWPYSSIHEFGEEEKTSKVSKNLGGLSVGGLSGKLNGNAKKTVMEWFGNYEAFRELHQDIGNIQSVFD